MIPWRQKQRSGLANKLTIYKACEGAINENLLGYCRYC